MCPAHILLCVLLFTLWTISWHCFPIYEPQMLTCSHCAMCLYPITLSNTVTFEHCGMANYKPKCGTPCVHDRQVTPPGWAGMNLHGCPIVDEPEPIGQHTDGVHTWWCQQGHSFGITELPTLITRRNYGSRTGNYTFQHKQGSYYTGRTNAVSVAM